MAAKTSFYVLSDTHYFSPSLMTPGKAFFNRQVSDQVLLLESGPIIDAAFEKLAADQEIDTILLHGDLINNGERINHVQFREKLETLRAAGKKVYITTATHDFATGAGMDNGFTPLKYLEDTTEPAEGMVREELREFYADYGFNQAYSIHEPSMSYAVNLGGGVRLLALNDDGNGRSFCGYYPDCVQWILDRAQEAREAGEMVIAMTHHPVIAPISVYPMMSERNMLGNYLKMQQLFADAGIQFIFTGHTHMHDIAMVRSAKGNPLYDIATGALVGYPAPIRKVTIADGQVTVTTEHPGSFTYAGETYDTLTYTRDKVDALLDAAVDAAREDHELFKVMADGFGIPGDPIDDNGMIITIVGNILNEATIGELSTMLGSGADVAEIADMPVKEVLKRVFRNLFGGSEDITPDTPEYRAIMGLVEAAPAVASNFGFELGEEIVEKIKNILNGVLYDAPPADDNAVLDVEELRL